MDCFRRTSQKVMPRVMPNQTTDKSTTHIVYNCDDCNTIILSQIKLNTIFCETCKEKKTFCRMNRSMK